MKHFDIPEIKIGMAVPCDPSKNYWSRFHGLWCQIPAKPWSYLFYFWSIHPAPLIPWFHILPCYACYQAEMVWISKVFFSPQCMQLQLPIGMNLLMRVTSAGNIKHTLEMCTLSSGWKILTRLHITIIIIISREEQRFHYPWIICSKFLACCNCFLLLQLADLQTCWLFIVCFCLC